MNEIYWYNCIGKSKKHKGNLWMIAVVPRAGTWIETMNEVIKSYKGFKSFPVRERGLKQFGLTVTKLPRRSFPVRERGLKHRA